MTGPCRRGDQCSNPRLETRRGPDGRVLYSRAPGWAEHGLCGLDTAQALRAVQQLPRDYLELSQLLGKASGGLGQSGGTRSLPVPVRLDVLALQEAIVWEAGLWASAVGEFDDVGAQGLRLRRAVEVLTASWPALLGVPALDVLRLDGAEVTLSGRSSVVGSVEDGVDGAVALLGLHERVALVEGRGRRAWRLSAPCPACDVVALERQDGSDQVDCRRCGLRMPMDRYERHGSALLAEFGVAA